MFTAVTEYPYLGLTLTSSMSWQTHINKVKSKANRMLGFIRRNLRSCPQSLRKQAYLTLVRPHLEYCCPIWNHYTRNNINNIEMIQRRAARFVFSNYHHRESVTQMLNKLNWDTLERRRRTASLLLMYKIHHNQIAVNQDQVITPMAPNTRRSYHPNKYQRLPCRIQAYSNSFYPRTVTWWNALPGNIIASPSIGVFRGAVSAHT